MCSSRTLAVGSALAFLVACGGGDPVQAPQEIGESPRLDFSAIAGTWSGWAVNPTGIQFWARFTLSESALEGSKVGTIEEGLVRGTATCFADALAVQAEDPVYVVEEVIQSTTTGCPDATARLEHDPDAGTLLVEWEVNEGGNAGSGVLTKGSDPGPKP